jgi:hypothetical protein
MPTSERTELDRTQQDSLNATCKRMVAGSIPTPGSEFSGFRASCAIRGDPGGQTRSQEPRAPQPARVRPPADAEGAPEDAPSHDSTEQRSTGHSVTPSRHQRTRRSEQREREQPHRHDRTLTRRHTRRHRTTHDTQRRRCEPLHQLDRQFLAERSRGHREAERAGTCSLDRRFPSGSAWRHPDRAVQPDRLSIQHRVVNYVLDELRELGGITEPTRMRNLTSERLPNFFRKCG